VRILFVYNKKAGKRFEPSVVDKITELMPQSVDYTFIDIRKVEAADVTSYDTLVAIGGDGTVNTVAKICTKQGKTLAVVPKGSGDGLARFLGISRNLKSAITTLLHGKQIHIDTAQIDDVFFINVAGAGFEAEVAHKFGAEGIRGLKGYAKTIWESFGSREEQEITLILDGKQTSLPFFSLSIANGAQWGNNFEIASAADIQDGFLDIAIMRKPKWHEVLTLITFLRSKKQEDNKLLTYYKASEIDVKGSGNFWHIDGEPLLLKNKKHIVVYPRNLKTIVPK
jgi:diacylglycerol kinase (ATP)